MTLANRVEHGPNGDAQVVWRTPTQTMVPVPSVQDALGIHHVNRTLALAGYAPDAPWWPVVKP